MTVNPSSHCEIEGCGQPVLARGWCSTHYMRWYRHGNPLDDGGVDRTGTGYQTVHALLREARGPASAHPCRVDGCGRQAHHWSWQHTGPTRTGEVGGRTITWGTNPEDYAPMCRRHHAILDGPGTLDAYACGHPRDHRKDCRVCRSERQRLARRS